MPKSNKSLVEQILSKRRGENDRLRYGWFMPYRNLGTWPDEARALVPVGVVAEIESFVRYVVKELIDAGEPFVERVETLSLKSQPSFESMKGLHGRHISLGDWVAHLLPISSVPHLDDHLSKLFAAKNLRSLLEGIRPFHGPSPEDFGFTEEGEPLQEGYAPSYEEESHVVDDPSGVIASLGRLFSARHEAAHEGSPPSLEPKVLEGWISDAGIFCDAIRHLVDKAVRPLEPQSTWMDEFKSGIDLDRENEALTEQLERLYHAIESLPDEESIDAEERCYMSGLSPISPKEFAGLARRAQEAWRAYEAAELEFQAHFWPDGTGWKAWRLTSATAIVVERRLRVEQSIRNL